jgi:outer membrane lipoprotein-sorting protein
MVSISISVAYAAMIANPQVEQAGDIVRRCNVSLTSAQTVVGNYLVAADGDQKFFGRVNFSLKKGSNLVLDSLRTTEIFRDNFQFVIDKRTKTYQVRDPRVFGVPYLIGFESFIDDDRISLKDYIKADQTSLVTFDGKLAAKVVNKYQTVYIDAVTALPAGYEYSVGGTKYLVRYRDVQLNKELKADTFSFTPSAGMKEVAVDSPAMLAINSLVPFKDSVASHKSLKTMIEGKKATVVAFIGNEGAPSSELVNRMRELAKTAPKELGMVVVSDKKDLRRIVQGRLGLNHIVETEISGNRLASVFGVSNRPSLYVLDSSGKVVHRQIGGSENLLREALGSVDIDLP